jgi:hypothetical protein
VNPVAVGACQLDAAQKEKIRLDSAGRDLAQVRAELWTRFRTRLIEYRRNPTSSYDPTLDDVLCLAADVSPVIARWTTILRLAFADQTETALDYVPLMDGGLRRLGTAIARRRSRSRSHEASHIQRSRNSGGGAGRVEKSAGIDRCASFAAGAATRTISSSSRPTIRRPSQDQHAGGWARDAGSGPHEGRDSAFPDPERPDSAAGGQSQDHPARERNGWSISSPLPVPPLFSGEQEWKLVWGADVAAAAGSPSVVA